jgi:hypothetical protein
MPATDLMTRLTKRKVTLSDNIAYICLKKFRCVSGHIPVNELARILGRYAHVVVNSKNGKPRTVSSADLLQFMGCEMEGGQAAQEEAKETPKDAETQETEPAVVEGSGYTKVAAPVALFAAAASGAAWLWMKKKE